MKDYLKHDEWKIIEDSFHASYNKISESLFSIGNGRFGQRGMFEEKYSGQTMQGSYVAGVYYPDKTRVGWWKNGYPEYFAKVLNAADWKSIHVKVNDDEVDIANCELLLFCRTLDMQTGTLTRTMQIKTKSGVVLDIESQRFCSIANDDTAAIKYSITPVNDNVRIQVSLFIDGNVSNADSNYEEMFWTEVSQTASGNQLMVITETRKTNFRVATGCQWIVAVDEKEVPCKTNHHTASMYAGANIETAILKGQMLTACKYVSIVTSQNYENTELQNACVNSLMWSANKGYFNLMNDNAEAWQHKWDEADIKIEGDVAAQQAIRFNIFQLNQTYTGKDARLNIGPKGFTGEKYGGSTYWDTEAYCIPFYLSTASETVARNLLMYRYKHLPKAIENAAKLGFNNGAALYPMVTMNGEECHNEWEITFEEIHRNGAIAYAIFNYSRYTGDKTYLYDYGLEVLIGISRFWYQRVNWSIEKNKYVMLGVTGPNEYENNVNNNWYTNLLAQWCLQYTIDSLNALKKIDIVKFKFLLEKISLNETLETDKWKDVIENIYLPEHNKLGIFLQQEGYMDKEQILVKDLPAENKPLNQKWSWDRILRSCFIKQADVLQGIYFFESNFTKEEIKRNFDFYEPRTVHESSLSPCIHAIIAAHIGDTDKAYEMYLRTARLDLNDYNNDTEDGCHTTSMAGTWMSIVEGFGGMRVNDDKLHFNPVLPVQWQSFSFKVRFRQHIIQLTINKNQIILDNITGENISVFIQNKLVTLKQDESTILNLKRKVLEQ